MKHLNKIYLILIPLLLSGCFYRKIPDKTPSELLLNETCKIEHVEEHQGFERVNLLGTILIGQPTRIITRISCRESVHGDHYGLNFFECVQELPNRGVFHSSCFEGEFCDQIISGAVICREI